MAWLDDIKVAKGALIGCVLGLAFWVLIGLAVWWLW